ncbi:cytochrome c biogenesis CcdA family protein [Mycolicibacterium fortuitum]|uniref:Cytochrome c biogenesis transmembrane protein n=1 Tax=Mycolicibacterium fortuitum subsp. fortuitum DSM 46621 = ATCC 6841 = JCM 6387 TaxID=1214102 RepID=K0VJ98_MYCFO|nr:cytochrome c biogenesis CcdA family protein [Mycolicibacterium fortuitum]AIY44632.1 Cytochrome c-type biogenesis protein CcdA (DsbD-like protein) [Mycobacterium sp. VKM Ac-1817D]CRL80786.1 cytochrome c biogenesis transmembrane protein [Mycolicibacter nonchromogenicus]AMD53728.1 thiol-disulfide oxidoreductase [Mycolicibacterium fortuitum subsp. fortuitum DSM 46621 = ATCC 6841 = JCM 6387]EJZ14958.1 cytochrome c biogenesis transmembrane protein [Mycolicibacterium fortuitum subsp. fortuitum DSM 
MSGVGLLGAFLGGLASLLSPCSALLLPSFFAYAFDRTRLLILRTFAFWVGLCAVLVPLGAGVGALGSVVTRYRSEVTVIGGLVLVGFGLMTLLGKGFGVSGMQRLTARINISGTVSVLALGAVYGLAGFCAGPLLGAVLTMSAMGADPVYGALLMAIYALGMATPLFLLAWLWDRFKLSERTWLRGRPVRLGPIETHTTSLLTGAMFIALGVVFLFTGGTANLGGVLSVDAQYDLQVWLGRLSSAVSDPVLILGVVTVLIAWRSILLWRRRAANESAKR